jgi:HTH-type transcriptional regulator/antitoxin HigA
VSDDPQEQAADAFAAESLTPRAYDAVIQGIRRVDEIKAIAEQLGVTPGIVAGRYRHLRGKWTHFGGLIRKFEWRVGE